MLERLQPLSPVQVICEASGGYEQPLLQFLHQKAVPVSLLNPARVRAFACSEGQRAQTDPLAAAMRLRFARENAPCRHHRPRHNKRRWLRGWIGAPSGASNWRARRIASRKARRSCTPASAP